MEGVHIDFERLAEWVGPKTKEDFSDLIKRFKKFETLAEDIVSVLKVAVEQGKTNHAVSMVRHTTELHCFKVSNTTCLTLNFTYIFGLYKKG